MKLKLINGGSFESNCGDKVTIHLPGRVSNNASLWITSQGSVR